MLVVPEAKDPAVLSYFALRKAVGVIALFLPFAVAIPLLLTAHAVATSISGYYYTPMRNLFVGSLCAIATFMLCTRGYDRRDEIADIFSGICALGVAFCPTAPETSPTHRQVVVGTAHYVFAALLFSTLAYFCLRLFQTTAANKPLTPMKLQRNRVFTVCGCAIIASMVLILVLKVALHVPYLVGSLGTTFVFETTSLIAFGYAWLVKGEAFFKDEPEKPATATTHVN